MAKYIVEGDFFFRHIETDDYHKVVKRSRKAYSTKAHPDDKSPLTWISKRIKRVYDEAGTLVFPLKKARSAPG